MIFKQNVLKEEIIKLGIVILCVCIPWIVIMIMGFMENDESNLLILMLLIILLPILLLILLIGLKNLEWFNIYDDRIDVRNIYGVKNSVSYDKIICVKEVKINLTTRGMVKVFYIFDDGRGDNHNAFNVNSCYNHRKLNLRIYKTKKLEDHIINTLQMSIT